MDINKVNKHEETALYLAAQRGDYAEVASLLDLDNDKNLDKNLDKNSGFCHCHCHCPDVNRPDHCDRTPLYVASMKGHHEVVQLLIQHPSILINAATNKGWTALYVASSSNQIKVVELLLSDKNSGFCLDVNASTYSGDTPLHKATAAQHTEVVKLLLSHPNINVNKTDVCGETALYIAAQYGYNDVVQLLLDCNNINVNQVDNQGATALWVAASRGHLTTVELLLASSSSSSVNTQLKTWNGAAYWQGKTAREIALLYEFHPTADLLACHEADPIKTRNHLRLKLGFNLQDAANLFALNLFVQDKFIQPNNKTPLLTSRFFRIISALPLELKMLLCNKLYSVHKDFISSHHIQKALKNIVIYYCSHPSLQ
jgi:ankyrin repeat protein